MLVRRRLRARHAVFTAVLTSLLAAPAARAGGPVDLTLTVSLEATPDPQGADGLRYEEILEDFAEIVFDASEGAHRVDTILVYTGGARHDTADVVWRLEGHPKATLNGVQGPGQMYMADVFAGAARDGGPLPLVDPEDVMDHPDGSLRAAGAVLAHEWAHYAYGLLDEHVIASGDIPVSSSLMSSPWTAASDVAWQNFSVAADATPGFGPYENTGATAHHRAYGRSAWELVGQPAAIGAQLVSPIPGRLERREWTELFGLPSGPLPAPQTPPAPPAIVWKQPCSHYVIAIDRSGSMTGALLATARSVADLLIQVLPAETTELSLVAFGSSAEVRFQQELVSDDDTGGTTQREILRDLLTGVGARPEATLFSQALLAAHPLFGTSCASGDPVTARALFFLSDATNSPGDGAALDAAIAPFTGDGIPIYAIDVSPFIAGELGNPMTPLVARTGGVLLGPNDFASFNEAQQAWALADAPNRIEHLLARRDGVELPTGASSNVFAFTVDPTLDRFQVCASASGVVGTLLLHPPSGSPRGQFAARQTEAGEPGDDCSFFWAQSSPAPGLWTVSAGSAATPGIRADFEARAQSESSSVTLRAWVSNASGASIAFPEPIHVTASLAQDRPLVGARVEASLPGGAPARLRDDGIPPDAFEDDGLYTGSLLYTSDLATQVQVSAQRLSGLSAFSSQGLVLAPGVGGNPVAAEPDEPVDFGFQRLVEIGVTTTGCCSESASVAFGGPVANGRISSPGEVDTYAIAGLAGVGQIRVSGALLGMRPRLRVFDASGNLVPGGDRSASGGSGGTTVEVQQGAVRAEVSHAFGGTGSYQLSAGPVLALSFPPPGGSGTPCEVASGDKNEALDALEREFAGVGAAQILISESREIERRMADAIEDLSDPSSQQKKARKLLRKAIGRDGKALSKLQKVVEKGSDEDLDGARQKIRNASKKLSKACSRLADGGASLLP